MSPLLSPESPELDDAHFSLLANYAKHLGRAPKAIRFATQSGERRSRQKGHGMEMLELRAYQASDDLRHIDWRVTARTGHAHTRLYAQENDHQRLLLLDLSSSAYFGTRHTFISTRFIQLAGIIAWRSKQQGDTLSYRMTYGDQEHASNKVATLSTLLSTLKDASKLVHRSCDNNTVSIWSNTPLTRKTHNKDVIILTDKQSWNDDEESALMKLAEHNTVHWIQIIDSNVFNLPAGQYQIADNSGIQSVSISKSSMQQAKADFLSQNTLMRNKLMSFGVRHQIFDITESPEKIARYLLSQGALH
ncbi:MULTISPECIES: DUF58 domain-containing protein [Marinomonas]|uniref:DUF58 domain-containing protein n=1 Tax=Marinomonas arctica TaxID=383750 RepID=A0A7H1J298_9GAMM|nr:MULTISPECIES: DUF58 domain-containing protein [Marinomonas]MCS7487864.1 hypothetical protein [Marinomonas sp. BSi20414]QNT04614.1 DUF58 domain-containing protein [Marinomonas arctica]GGN32758.1 hypothetical protein GCM10011350_27550 [Marinomonas arctica]